MLKKVVRAASRITKKWLAEEENVESNNYGSPPFGYTELNRLLPKIAGPNLYIDRPDYAWGALQGVNLAKALRLERVSLIEFGVAGGNGLVALERIAQSLESIFGVEIEIYGFDAVGGMPRSKDYRDLPNLWREGHYAMDEGRLRQRLKKARLILGMVEETVPQFIESRPAPIAFIAFDLCFYSSTVNAFQVFEADQSILLPRVHCFFRNILARTFGDHNGERLAITDFNATHQLRKISKIHGLQYYVSPPLGRQRWVEQFYMTHISDHELYGDYDGLITQTTRDLREEPALEFQKSKPR
jgi:hypothetical protein